MSYFFVLHPCPTWSCIFVCFRLSSQCGLFVYDIFWVFGTDVMVTVAKVRKYVSTSTLYFHCFSIMDLFITILRPFTFSRLRHVSAMTYVLSLSRLLLKSSSPSRTIHGSNLFWDLVTLYSPESLSQ